MRNTLTLQEALAAQDLRTCCDLTYGSPAARWLLGDSFHPGGLDLTTRLAEQLGISPTSRVLDVGSGTGATAVHLAKTIGCEVVGLTLEAGGARAGQDLARQRGVEGQAEFRQGDVHGMDLPAESFDFVLMECVLSILDDKAGAVSKVREVLKLGGRIGLTDVTVDGPLPPELRGVLATIGCVGGAASLADYQALLKKQGLVVEYLEDCVDAASGFLKDIGAKLFVADVARGLGKLELNGGVLDEALLLLVSAQKQVERGVLGYGMVVARKGAGR